MAGTYDNLVILQRYVHELFMVADTEFRQILNAETGGTIVSATRPTDGNYFTDTYWGSELDLVRLEAPNVQATATKKNLQRISQVDIKTAITSDAIVWQRIANRWAGMPADEQAVRGAQRIISLFQKEKIKAAVASLVAFFARGQLSTGKDTEIEKVIHDISGSAVAETAKLDLAKLHSAKMKFGDEMDAFRGIIMHSGAFEGMGLRNIAQYSELFSGMYGQNFPKVTADGIPIFITDNPALTFQTTGPTITKYRTLLLTDMAVSIYDNGYFDSHIDVSNDNTWIERTYKAETDFNVKVKAGTWADTSKVHPKIGTTDATGVLKGLHTDDGVLDNPASWARVGLPNHGIPFKQLPGVMIISQ